LSVLAAVVAIEIEFPALRALRHQHEAETRPRNAVFDGDAGLSLEHGAAQVARCSIERVAAIAGQNLRRRL
jgi:hypothetical protein